MDRHIYVHGCCMVISSSSFDHWRDSKDDRYGDSDNVSDNEISIDDERSR